MKSTFRSLKSWSGGDPHGLRSRAQGIGTVRVEQRDEGRAALATWARAPELLLTPPPPRSRARTSSRSEAGDSTTTSEPKLSTSSASPTGARDSSSRSQPDVGVRAVHLGDDPLRLTAKWQRAAGPCEEHHPLGGARVGREPAGHRTDVDSRRYVVGPRGADPACASAHAREPEDALVAAIGVEPHDVPTSGVAGHPPRLQVPGPALGLPRAGVLELDRVTLLGRLPEHLEGGLLRAQARLGDLQRGRVDVDAGRSQLAHGLGGRLGQRRVLPHPGGEPDDRRLVGLERDVGQGELVGADPVAGFVVEVRIDLADLDRHTQAAELLLVALEHLLEGVRGGVGVDDGADAVLGDVVPLDQQHDQQVQQPLALRHRHPRDAIRSRGRRSRRRACRRPRCPRLARPCRTRTRAGPG